MTVMKLTLEYDGTFYHGWQKQPHLPTVQGALEKALFQLTGDKITIQGAGRTDAGVHAYGQVASFTSEKRFEPDVWARALNALLPADIAVRSAEAAPSDFHARFSAKKKTYSYLIYNNRRRSPLRRMVAWHVYQPLDVRKMRAAAGRLIGEHDFTSFCAASSEAKDRRLHLQKIEVTQEGDQIRMTFEAPRFLQYMIRNIVGFLVEIGRGKRAASDASLVLERKDRRTAGPTAPPQGLFLVKIEY
ncbi:MAG TPA: tRNA pseudouridine(38-40) synthase TruA [Candidatus Manganitrophaceae bacterium]|nr:tRNA pseudouridine(38-40) synthase TruA [Candidatus Manganitrophaceae bacterium]